MNIGQIWSDFKRGLRPLLIGLAWVVGVVGGVVALLMLCMTYDVVVYGVIAILLVALACIIGGLKRTTGR